MPDSLELSDTDSLDQKCGRTGRLEMTFRPDPEGRTYLAEQYSTYPFHICRAQYMDREMPDMATLYTQSCAGGVFTGDQLSMAIHGQENSRVHVTTQASTIVHRMEGGCARQSVEIVADPGALIEYLPDSTILFPEAKFQSSIIVRRHPDSDVIIGDSFLAHDPNGTDRPFGWYENELVIQQPDKKVDAVDRFAIAGRSFIAGETTAAQHYTVHGTFAVISHQANDCAFVQMLRSCVDTHAGVYAGVSRLPGDIGCWVRYLAIDGVMANTIATSLWSAAREMLTGRSPDLRRK